MTIKYLLFNYFFVWVFLGIRFVRALSISYHYLYTKCGCTWSTFTLTWNWSSRWLWTFLLIITLFRLRNSRFWILPIKCINIDFTRFHILVFIYNRILKLLTSFIFSFFLQTSIWPWLKRIFILRRYRH